MEVLLQNTIRNGVILPKSGYSCYLYFHRALDTESSGPTLFHQRLHFFIPCRR